MLFKRYAYEQQAAHLEVHARMVDRISSYRDRYQRGEKDIGAELLEFLKEWLYRHLLEDGMAYTEYLIAQGAR